jgi:hypothetical protein
MVSDLPVFPSLPRGFFSFWNSKVKRPGYCLDTSIQSTLTFSFVIFNCKILFSRLFHIFEVRLDVSIVNMLSVVLVVPNTKSLTSFLDLFLYACTLAVWLCHEIVKIGNLFHSFKNLLSPRFRDSGPRSSSFWFPRNHSHHMIRQASTDGTMLAMLVKNREMTGRIQTRPWWLGGEGVKTTENKILWPRCLGQSRG